MGSAPARVCQKANFDAGIPLTSFGAVAAEAAYQRLKGLVVVFMMPPTRMGPIMIAMFDDTCTDPIQIAQQGRVHRLRAAA
jgi:hypothetical protein